MSDKPERKLASVQKIVSIEPIEGADRIVLARVLGWQLVTQKSNNFKPGDLVCFFEVDSQLPATPPFEFLRKSPDETSFRLKTIRLKGKVSQGLILPLDNVYVEGNDGKVTLCDANHPDVKDNPMASWDYMYKFVREGDDLTEWLGVTKYEPPLPAQLRGLVYGQFPHFLAKTDETRIQSCPGVLERHRGKQFFITEKIDGTSFTCFYYPHDEKNGLPIPAEDAEKGYTFGVCSRSLHLKHSPDNTYWKIAEKYDLENKLKAGGVPMAIQGEVFGLGIQGNKLQRTSIELRVFNIYHLGEKRFLNYFGGEFHTLAGALDLPTVPVLDSITLDHTVDQLVIRSMVKSQINPNVWAEGIVLRPEEEGTDSDLGRLSFKVINPEFLLKFGE